jgi:hypothetical protein
MACQTATVRLSSDEATDLHILGDYRKSRVGSKVQHIPHEKQPLRTPEWENNPKGVEEQQVEPNKTQEADRSAGKGRRDALDSSPFQEEQAPKREFML